MTDDYDSLLYDKAHSYGIAAGKAECILETLSDYGEVPLRIREQILASLGEAKGDPASRRILEVREERQQILAALTYYESI